MEAGKKSRRKILPKKFPSEAVVTVPLKLEPIIIHKAG